MLVAAIENVQKYIQAPAGRHVSSNSGGESNKKN
jgi:hypothetical protein